MHMLIRHIHMRNSIKLELIKFYIPKYDCSKGANIEILRRHYKDFNLAPN
jgi:hypothetical protein